FVDRNNTGMIKAGGGFRFTSKALQMRFSRPMAKADHFQCDRAIETSLPGTIYNTLATAADLVEQFIIAEVGQRLCAIRFLLITRQWHAFTRAGVIPLLRDYRFAREEIEAGLEEASGAKSLRCVGENLRSALSTKSKYAAHYRRVVHARSPSCTARNSITRYDRNTAIKWRSSSSTSLAMATVWLISSRNN